MEATVQMTVFQVTFQNTSLVEDGPVVLEADEDLVAELQARRRSEERELDRVVDRVGDDDEHHHDRRQHVGIVGAVLPDLLQHAGTRRRRSARGLGLADHRGHPGSPPAPDKKDRRRRGRRRSMVRRRPD